MRNTTRTTTTTAMRAAAAALAVSFAAMGFAGCGGGGGEASDTTVAVITDANGHRIIDFAMEEMFFVPSIASGKVGETVTFRFRNRGKVAHEAIIGDVATQSAHVSGMTAGAAPAPGDPPMILVQPGQVAELTTTLQAPGQIIIGCHQVGHYEAGMKATLYIV